MGDEDEDDLGAFSFLSTTANLVIEDDEDIAEDEGVPTSTSNGSLQSAHLVEVDRLLMLRDIAGLTKLKDSGNEEERRVAEIAAALLEGEHASLVCGGQQQDGIVVVSRQVVSACLNDVDAVDAIRRLVLEYIEKGATSNEKECRAVECCVLASAFLELYCQANYTGPELSSASVGEIVGVAGAGNEDKLRSAAVRFLECDGEWAYGMCEIPHCLLVARSMFLALAEPTRAAWDRGVTLSEGGEILSKTSKIDFVKRFPHACRCGRAIPSIAWRSARAAVVHARLLPSLSHDRVPTLWKECSDLFDSALQRWTSLETKDDRILRTQLLLECGLSHHHFGQEDKGKGLFARAREAAALEVQLTGAMGKRTKHQQDEHAQMLLVARSFLSSSPSAPSDSNNATPPPPPPPAPAPAPAPESGNTQEGWQHSDWEIGRRLLSETEGGEVASVREVLLDSMDGGAAQNIFLEGGPKFSDPGLDRGGDLHPVDQAVILALCLDVSNSNPSDGLTTEVMMPYLLRVLEQAKNWMIHSTGLLERSWLEYHLQRTADRAMLQIQALLDQHTTKLTIMQSTYKSITEDSAPAQDRLAYLHCIVYPAQYELKKDLAQRYLQSSVVVSALGLFRELELWDEVVTCYQLMEKPHRAEMVVRERLRASGETPYMLTALADLTSDERLYEKAWELSRHRYGRAKRTLAKICYDRGDNRACVSHLVEALAIHPLQPNMWYLKGLACMRFEAYDDALQAFTRCVQQDMEIGEAWANSGAIFMKRCQHAKAYVSLSEALRHKRDSWQVIENLMICCLVLSRWREGVVHMNKLLDLRNKSDRPVHKDELRHLALVVSSKARLDFEELKASGGRGPGTAEEGEAKEEGESEGDGKVTNLPTPAEIAEAEAKAAQTAQAGEQNGGVEEICDEDLPEVAKAVEKLLVRITNTLPSDADIWDILARFEAFLGRQRLVLECRVRQFRTMSNAPGWEKDRAKVAPVLQAAEKLVEAHHPRFNRRKEVVKREDFLACKSMLQQAQRKIDVVFEGMEESLRLQEITKGLTEIV